jgi:hypothetical protein
MEQVAFSQAVDCLERKRQVALLATWQIHCLVVFNMCTVQQYNAAANYRCAMHGFNLVLGSVLAYSWSKNLVVRAQQVVTYFRASHAPLAALRKAAEELHITQGLQSSNTTRFTSNYACTSSVQGHAPAFTLVKQRGSVVITNQDVAATLEDAAFWADLAKLNKVLKPISRVVMVVQGDSTTLADICR